MAANMKLATETSEARFVAEVESLARALGHVDRAQPLKDYCAGLPMPGERKSVEPIAAIVASARVSAEHQSLPHFVGQASWSDGAVLAKVRELVLPTIEAHGPIEAWIVDAAGFAKKGVQSVGVARQYCGLMAMRAAIPPLRPRLARKNLAFPIVQNGEAPTTRPERHVENSIAT
jgi:SRSO17 transposase